MARLQAEHIVIVGAGAAGLMAASELGRRGRAVTILEARDRCGGRIYPLPATDFGYPAAGGAEFVHGEAPVTRSLLRQAGLALVPLQGSRWAVENRKLVRGQAENPHESELHNALQELKNDVPIAEFLRSHFAGPRYDRLRRSIERMAEGYDAADPERASTLALRDEWMDGGRNSQARIAGGYGSLIDFLVAECRRVGTAIRLGSAVTAIDPTDGDGLRVRCANGDTFVADIVVLTLPPPLLQQMALPDVVRNRAAAVAHIGYGNVIKILLRFETCWWTDCRADLHDLGFLHSDAPIPVWWTQFPDPRPVLTGWFGGPKTQAMSHLDEHQLIEAGLASLAENFNLAHGQLKQSLVAARSIDWGRDPFARGAYSYATVHTRDAQAALARTEGSAVLFSGEALYRGKDMGTVEAALASGLETARIILRG